MRRLFAITCMIGLAWAVSAQAEREREHEFRPGPRFERRSLPPMRESFPAVHSIAPRHEPVRAMQASDPRVCDNPDGDPDAAIDACSRIIARGQIKGGYSLPVAYVHRGQAMQDKADFPHAVEDFSAAIDLKPTMPGYFVMRGTAREKQGDVAAAEGDFRQAAKLDAGNQEALNALKRIETRSMAVPAATQAEASPAATAPVTTPAPATAIPAAAQTATTTAPAAQTGRVPATQTQATQVTTTSAPAPGKAPRSEAGVAAAAVATATVAATATSNTPATPPSPAVVTASAAPPVAPASASGATPAAASAPLSGAAATAAVAAKPGSRVALVIGNGAYVNANQLPNPPTDAHAMAGVLREIGFDVSEGINLTHDQMENQFRTFLHKAQGASVVLLFYAGHGMQVDGKNYLVPVDAKLAEATDLPFETIDIDKIMEGLGDPTHTNIILLDACRDNPLARSFASHLPAARGIAVGGGLAAYTAVGTGTLIAYATAPGQTALDGQGADSPFTTSLMHNLRTPGLEIRQVLTRVRAEVAAETGNKQIPWDNSSLMGDVYLVPKSQ